MKSLKQEFRDIMRQYGHPALLVRNEKKVRCSCYDRKTQSSPRDCPKCFGLGHVPLVEKHTIRDMDSGVPLSYPLIGEGKSFGDIVVSGRAYFFLPEVNVRVKDLILDVGWKNGYPVFEQGNIWEVSHVDPQRFERGELIFQKVYVKENPVELSIRGFHIRQVEGVTSYELIQRKEGE